MIVVEGTLTDGTAMGDSFKKNGFHLNGAASLPNEKAHDFPALPKKVDDELVEPDELAITLKEHLERLGLWGKEGEAEYTKERIRLLHSAQRERFRDRIIKSLGEERVKEFVEKLYRLRR